MSNAANWDVGVPFAPTGFTTWGETLSDEVDTLFDTRPMFINYDTVGESWPPAPSGAVQVVWVQPVVGGPEPPSGGRPGREPNDIVLLAQAS